MARKAIHLLVVVHYALAFCFGGLASALRVDIVPETVDDLSTDTVTITCGATESPDGTRNVVLMELGKRGEHPLVTLGKTKLKYGANKNSGMEAQGNIDEANTSQSYLRLTIKNPGMENGGMYVCRLFYVDGLGELKDVTAYGNMTVDVSSKIKEQIKKQAKERITMQLVQNLTDKVSTLEMTDKDRTSLLQVQGRDLKECEARFSSLDETVETQGRILGEQEKHSKEHEVKVSSEISNLVSKEQTNSASIQDLVDKGSSVSAFSAGYDGKDTVIQGTTMLFRQPIFDLGHDYDTTTGIFTAPRRGLYVFHLTVRTFKKGSHIDVNIQVNDVTIAILYALEEYYLDQSSISTVVSLQPGDKVKPFVKYVTSKAIAHPSNMYSMFTGYLMQPL